MHELIEIVQKVNQAFLDKDETTLRAHLAPDYTYVGPVEDMNIEGIEACVALMHGFDLRPVNAKSEWISDTNRVVEIFEWTLETPVSCVVPMVEITTFDNQQITSTRAFFNPALLPSIS